MLSISGKYFIGENFSSFANLIFQFLFFFFFSRGLFAACDLSVFLVVGKLHDSEGPVIFMQI